MDSAALLRIWSETTPRAIFPNRQIGRLAPGYEASFLVVDEDPRVDLVYSSKLTHINEKDAATQHVLQT
jgi:predicted amidohydrolase YtcJ